MRLQVGISSKFQTFQEMQIAEDVYTVGNNSGGRKNLEGKFKSSKPPVLFENVDKDRGVVAIYCEFDQLSAGGGVVRAG